MTRIERKKKEKRGKKERERVDVPLVSEAESRFSPLAGEETGAGSKSVKEASRKNAPAELLRLSIGGGEGGAMKNDTWLRTGTKTFGSKTKSYEECMHGTKWGEASTKKECLVGARGKKK